MPSTIIVRYGELALKSEPVRRRFEHGLVNSMKRVLGGLSFQILTERGRIFVETGSTAAAIKRLTKVPGITSLSPSVKVEASINAIRSCSVKIAKKLLRKGMSFAIRTNRVGNQPFSSKDVNTEIGSSVMSAVKGLRVDLSKPDVEISIDIRGESAYVFSSTVSGVGGLPVGTQGKVVSIFSGTKNDFAAAFMMIKRGCTLFPIFLNPEDVTNNPSARRIISSAKKLTDFDSAPTLWIFPFKRTSEAIMKESAGELEFYVLRRCALRAAETIAKRVGAEAIVLGDDAELIAAQRLQNVGAIDAACKMAVLRPLAGLEEDDINQIVERVGLKPKAEKPVKRPYVGSGAAVKKRLEELEREINIKRIIDDDSKKAKSVKLVST